MAIKKVMVVDDSATERHVLGEILGKKCYEQLFNRAFPEAAQEYARLYAERAGAPVEKAGPARRRHTR